MATNKRGANFTMAEKALIVELVEPNLHIINSKFKSTVSNQQKMKIWDDIASKLNARGGDRRSGQQVKEKWRKCCGSAREMISTEKQHAR